MNEIKQIEPEYVYVTIPAEYICVYHRILAMMADYGEDMLKDCKANCTDRNSGVIECFNMFNSAVAARKLGKDKLAALIIKYIKVKINQIYKDKDNSTSFVFPVDETGQLKAFVSCGERPKFEINPDDMNLYEHKFNNGFDEHFKLGPEDESKDIVDVDISSDDSDSTEPPTPSTQGLSIVLLPRYENVSNEVRPCADINVYFDGEEINVNATTYQYYFDDKPVNRFNDVSNLSTGVHNFKIVVTYNGQTKIESVDKAYNTIDIKPDKPIVTKKKNEMYKTIIANKAVPYFTAREGQVYCTRQITIQVPEEGLTDTQINDIENKIKDGFSKFGTIQYNCIYHDGQINVSSSDTLLDAYKGYQTLNANVEHKCLSIDLHTNNARNSNERIYCAKHKNGFVFYNNPPYGNFPFWNFPDYISLNDEEANKRLVLWRYRKMKNKIIKRINGRIQSITEVGVELTKSGAWKTYSWKRLYLRLGYHHIPFIIKVSRKGRSRYGFAYYTLINKTNGLYKRLDGFKY